MNHTASSEPFRGDFIWIEFHHGDHITMIIEIEFAISGWPTEDTLS